MFAATKVTIADRVVRQDVKPRARLAQIKDDATGRTFEEVIADNLVRIACSESPSAVHAANEIADRIEGRPPQHL